MVSCDIGYKNDLSVVPVATYSKSSMWLQKLLYSKLLKPLFKKKKKKTSLPVSYTKKLDQPPQCAGGNLLPIKLKLVVLVLHIQTSNDNWTHSISKVDSSRGL